MQNEKTKKLLRKGLLALGATPSKATTWGEHYDLNTRYGLLTVGIHADVVHGRGSKQLVSCYSRFEKRESLPAKDTELVMPNITNGGNYTGKYNWIHWAESFFDEAQFADMVLRDIKGVLPVSP